MQLVLRSGRAKVADALVRIVSGQSTLDAVLSEIRAAEAAPSAAFIQECLYGVCRRYYSLGALLDRCLDKPLRGRDLPLRMLLLAGLNEATRMSTPAYALVDEAVNACEDLGRPWARALVNAVLRKALRERDATQANEAGSEASWDHPAWLIEAVRADWPDHWQAILEAGNARAPMTLRVNLQRVARAQYLAQLTDAGHAAQATTHSPAGLILTQPCPVSALPGFAEGSCSVQDEAAQLAASLLDCAPGNRVLDACAAPGGKSAHLLEQTPGIDLLALDSSERRLRDCNATLARLGLVCRTVQADARCFAPVDNSGTPTFDRILLDAPCSATGVIRRHPDIKLRRAATDVQAATVTQRELLDNLWRHLAPGGMLLYATCSVLRAENDEVIAHFCSATQDVRHVPLTADWGVATRFGRQTLPGESDMDGFYYALLEKRA